MKRPAAALLGCLSILLLISVVSIATIPTTQVGTWQPIGSMATARSGATAVLLNDQRILIAGGNDPNGALGTAEFFNPDGSFSAAPPMLTARTGHSATVLKDGSVLVAGGVTAGGGATNSAEIYDPTGNSWVAVAGGMSEARTGATATLLNDGRVLIAGGQNGGAPSQTVEIYNPISGIFTFAGMLSE